MHPLLASCLAPRVPQICLETALSFLCYLQSGGHSVKTRKSLKSLLKSSYFTRLKIRPWISRFRKTYYRRSSRHCFLGKQELRSTWWGDQTLPDHRNSIPLRFLSYRSEYASSYELRCTYRYALLFLPIFLTKAPPDSLLASIATDSVFNSFCTAYPRETKKAKKSITQYLFRYRPLRSMASVTKCVVSGVTAMDVDSVVGDMNAMDVDCLVDTGMITMDVD